MKYNYFNIAYLFEARSILHLLYGEEYPVSLPEMPSLLDTMLMQNMAINFKNGQISVAENNPREKVGSPYPNPANGTLTIDVQLNKDDIADFCLFDVTGMLIYTCKLTVNGQNTIDIAKLSQGIYINKIVINGITVRTSKLVIVR